LKASRRGDVQNASTAPTQHPGQEQPGKVGKGDDIQLQHPDELGLVHVGKLTMQPIPSIISQHIDLCPVQVPHQRSGGITADQIHRNNISTYRKLAGKLLRDVSELRFVSRHENYIVACLGQLPSDCLADAPVTSAVPVLVCVELDAVVIPIGLCNLTALGEQLSSIAIPALMTIAILFALAAQDRLDLLAITTVAGNVPLDLTSRNARIVLDWANCEHLSV
jgi:hypothetical protein